MGILPFKANYVYKLKILLSPKQVKKSSKTAKEKVEIFINLYKNLQGAVVFIQKRIKRYYNLKVSKGLDLKEGDKVQLLYKNFLNKRLSKKLNYIKLGLFKILRKITEINYKLDLLAKIKIYLVQYITMLKLVYREYKPPLYKVNMYRGYKEDKQEIQKVIYYQEIDNIIQYKIK